MAGETPRDRRFMSLALEQARRGVGRTSPNPPVGAVIVRGGRVAGVGSHRRAGEPHAEVDALRRARARARGATLYVTLEPCDHHGRTPPCTEAIVRAGIRRVVVGTTDPNPVTDGRGLARLRRAGVQVTTGVLRAEAQRLIEPFSSAMRRRRPLVVAKIAQSLDGKIATATGASRWITSAASRRAAHALRAQADAILVGIRTVLADDPRLTVRGVAHRRDRPLKVILDSQLRLPPAARCLATPPGALVATTSADPQRRAALEARGAEVLVFPPEAGRVPMRRLLETLAARGIHSVLLEGGGELLAGALAEGLVDRVVWFVAPILIGGRETPGAVGGQGILALSEAIGLRDVSVTRVGQDLRVDARVVYPRHESRSGAGGRRRGARASRPRSVPVGVPRPAPLAPPMVA